MRNSYTKEMLKEAVKNSSSIAGVIRHFGLRLTGGSYSNFNRLIALHQIDTSHFLGQGSNRGDAHRGGPARKTAEQILVLGDPGDYPTKATKLTRALIEIGRLYACEACGQGSEWQGGSLRLEVDHRNGRRWDNRPDNLRFLCPNCHTQTPNYGSRNTTRA